MEEMKKYEWMDNEKLAELQTSNDFINYFICVKQDLLIKLDSANWSIMNCKFKFEQAKSRNLLETDFKTEYGKDNESIRKAHIQKEYKDILEQLEVFKNNKSHYENQLKLVDDILKANLMLLSASKGCDCDGC